MKKELMSVVAVLALASCSSDSMVTEVPTNTETPIAFTVSQRNSTRDGETTTTPSNKLEDNGYSDFGVFAYKVKNSEPSTSSLVMQNYKVAYKEISTSSTEKDWLYVGVDNQIEHYWDYSTDVTNFYAYAPHASATAFDADGKTITVSQTAGYDATNDVIYAGNSIAKSNYNQKVPLAFKHVGAKVRLAFKEAISGYKVELINVSTENGFELTPAIKATTEGVDTYTKTGAAYNTTSQVAITYNNPTAPTTKASTTGATTSSDNLKFDLPATTVLSESNYNVSQTTYYAVVQPEDAKTGFTLHVSYKLTAEDASNEVITVRDARVFIPADMVKWESNKSYTYNFTITKGSTGTTDDTTTVDTTNPEVPTTPALNPIVFDTPTITDYESATINPSDTNI